MIKRTTTALLRLENLRRAFSSATSNKKYAFRCTSQILPHPEKVYKGGEDALCYKDNMIAVADGVGGWADAGVDPGIYSKKLCRLISQHYDRTPEHYIDNPHLLLETCVGLNKEMGSSTICIVTVNPNNGVLRAAYMGDSVYSILRGKPYKEIYTAPENQRSFNFPYQVGTHGDDPSTCVKEQTQGEEKDLILVASDGLWDNIANEAIQKIIVQNCADDHSIKLEEAGEKLAKETYKLSLSRNYKSPFHVRALKAKLYYPPQGKSDDISLVLAEVVLKD